MTQQTALIVHELMDQPDAWREKSDGIISNGYYIVSLDGCRYGMGVSTYHADAFEKESLMKAVDAWKMETGWKPKEVKQQDYSVQGRVYIAPDAYIRQAYEEFSRAIRGAHKSFVVHKDTSVLNSLISKAIEKLDSLIRPMEKIEGKTTNAEPSGIPSA